MAASSDSLSNAGSLLPEYGSCLSECCRTCQGGDRGRGTVQSSVIVLRVILSGLFGLFEELCCAQHLYDGFGDTVLGLDALVAS